MLPVGVKSLKCHISFQDKEYPVKSLRISELQKEIENLKIAHQVSFLASWLFLDSH